MKKLLVLLLLIITCFSCKEEPNKTTSTIVKNELSGPALGTSYSIQFLTDKEIDFSSTIDSLFTVVNTSMSTYQKDSDISKINRNEANEVDAHFIRVYNKAQEIYEKTDGIFDPTIGVMVNAWDFGPQGAVESLDSLKIDSLMTAVGFKDTQLLGNKLMKKHPQTFIDYNAIAKGYTVDLISEFLEEQNIDNYIVEIGGEIRCKGKNLIKDSLWTIGIEDPNFDGSRSHSKVISLTNQSMATSGSYRKFKLDQNG